MISIAQEMAKTLDREEEPTMPRPLLNWTGDSWLLEWWEGESRGVIEIYPEGDVIYLQRYDGTVSVQELRKWK